MKKYFNKFFISSLIGAILGVMIGVIIAAPITNASFLGDIWHNLTQPFSGLFNNTTTTPTTPTPVNQISTSSLNLIPGPNQTESISSTQNQNLDYQTRVIDAVKKASPAVVAIIISKYVPIIEECPYNPFADLPPEFQQFFGGNNMQFSVPCESGKKQLQEVGGGSGFIISSNGLILTNKHVASDKNATYTVILNDGRKFPATILAQDPLQDLAIIKINATNLPTISLGNSDNLSLGQTAIAIGNALGEFRNTVSVGVVSGLERQITAQGASYGPETITNLIQTDAAINPGNSGGPLLNLDGEVIGINVAMAQGAQNIGFAIPINQAKKDIISVEQTGKIEVPYLGVNYLIINPQIAKEKNLDVDYGALIEGTTSTPAVEPNSPADKAGLKANDIILQINNQKIDNNNPLANIISQFSIGQTVTLKVDRNGQILDIPVTLGIRPENL